MRNQLRLALVLASLAGAGCWLPGCAGSSTSTFGNSSLRPEKVERIQRGVSTRADVEQLFGSAMSVEMQGDGRRKMVYVCSVSEDEPDARNWIPYYNRVSHHADLNTTQQVLQVLLSASDVVEDYEYTHRSISGQSVIHPWGGSNKATVSTTSQSPR